MFERQAHHFILLTILVVGVVALLDDDLLAGQLAGIPTGTWLFWAILVPVLHQTYVWFVWRLELYHSWVSRRFGKKGFIYYAVGFTVLFVSRLVVIVLLALSNRNSLKLHPVVSFMLAGSLMLPSLYLFHSVRKYFGFKRAFGIDHFDVSYRHRPFVREGIFKYTKNAMYTFGFCLLWVPGLIFFSKTALVAALFNHLYIWVHYYCTELPDIRRIYG